LTISDVKIERTEELTKILQENNYQTFVEVGVYNGDNILTLANRFPNVKFIGIDPYFDGEYNDRYEQRNKQYWDDKYMKVLNKAKALGNVTIIRKQSLDASLEFEKESVDIVFIDAIHTYKDCKDDINHWLKVVKPNGILSGHDYSTRFFGVIMAVNELLGVDNVRIGAESTWFYNK
jgi:predicted O-methyltransferase YrrM